MGVGLEAGILRTPLYQLDEKQGFDIFGDEAMRVVSCVRKVFESRASISKNYGI
jgi:hypothetical protein